MSFNHRPPPPLLIPPTPKTPRRRSPGYKGNTRLVWSGEGKVASEDGARLRTDVAIFTGPLTVVRACVRACVRGRCTIA